VIAGRSRSPPRKISLHKTNGCGARSPALRRRLPRTRERGEKTGLLHQLSRLPKKEARSVKKTSSSVLTSNPALAYKPPIETAPPLSGASSALPKDVGLRPVRRVMSCRFCRSCRCLTIEDCERETWTAEFLRACFRASQVEKLRCAAFNKNHLPGC